MGSGCTESNNKYSCPQGTIYDTCVIYTGDSIPALGICKGDRLNEIEKIILIKILEVFNGTDITLDTLTAKCEEVNNKLLNSDKKLLSVLKIILDNQCDLKTAIDGISYEPWIHPQLCFSSAVTNRTEWELEISKKVCQLIDDLATIQSSSTNTTTVVENILKTKLNSCNGGITATGTGSTFQVSFKGIIPIGGRLFGDFPSSSFNATGEGLNELCGFALCNGLNGTPDLRDYVPAMASSFQGVARTFTNITNIGDTKGENTQVIAANQIPNHTHDVTFITSPHNHTTLSPHKTPDTSKTKKVLEETSGSGIDVLTPTNASTTAIQASNAYSYSPVSVGDVQGQTNQPLNNIQPTYYGVWIQRIN